VYADPEFCGCVTHNGFLTRTGYRALAEAEQRRYLDSVGSVSAMPETEITMIFDEEILDEQHRRFLEPSFGG